MMSKERINVFLVRNTLPYGCGLPKFCTREFLSSGIYLHHEQSVGVFLTSQSEELKPSSHFPSFSEIHLFTGAGYVYPCLSDKT